MGLYECNTPAQSFNAEREKKVAERAATQMRSACVEKVRELRDRWQQKGGDKPVYAAMWDTADKIIQHLESVTLDQVEQEKR